MPIQHADCWIDDTLDDSNFTIRRKPLSEEDNPKHHELYMLEGG